MSIAGPLIRNYYHRTNRPGAHQRDAWFQYQTSVLRDLLGLLEVILQDQGILSETEIRHVLQCLLYGSPHPADAELRQEQQELLAEALQYRDPMVVISPDNSMFAAAMDRILQKKTDGTG